MTVAGQKSRVRLAAYVGLAVIGVAAMTAAAFFVASRVYDRPLPTFHRLTFRRGVVDNAFFTPDGQSVLYTARWDGEAREVFTIRADGVDSVPRDGLKGFNVVAISSKNELALIRRATLSTAPLASGAPRELHKAVAVRTGARTVRSLRSFGAARSNTRSARLSTGRGSRFDPIRRKYVRVSPRGDLLAFRETGQSRLDRGRRCGRRKEGRVVQTRRIDRALLDTGRRRSVVLGRRPNRQGGSCPESGRPGAQRAPAPLADTQRHQPGRASTPQY